MGKLEISRVTNANVYVDGSNFLGRCSEVVLPTIKRKMVPHDALGLASEVELPARGVEKMEASFKWASFYKEVIKKTANPNAIVQLQLRASIDAYTGEGLSGEAGLVVSLGGIFHENPLGSYKKQESVAYETKMTVYYIKVVADLEELLEIDVLNNIDKVAGVDILSRFRSLIGG